MAAQTFRRNSVHGTFGSLANRGRGNLHAGEMARKLSGQGLKLLNTEAPPVQPPPPSAPTPPAPASEERLNNCPGKPNCPCGGDKAKCKGEHEEGEMEKEPKKLTNDEVKEIYRKMRKEMLTK